MASETIKKSQRPGMRRAKIIKMKSENEVANAKRIFDHTWPFGSLAVLRPNYCDGRYNLGGGYLIWEIGVGKEISSQILPSHNEENHRYDSKISFSYCEAYI